jgi:uncharacterized membrane protein
LGLFITMPISIYSMVLIYRSLSRSNASIMIKNSAPTVQ